MSSWRRFWAPVVVAASSGVLATAAILAFWPNRQQYVVPVDGVVAPRYTPFTHIPTKPVRKPIPSTAYLPKGR